MAASNEYFDHQSPETQATGAQTPGLGCDATKPDKFTALAGDHWYEMTASLCPESTAVLGDWIEEDLALLETKFSHFATPGSLQSRRNR